MLKKLVYTAVLSAAIASVAAIAANQKKQPVSLAMNAFVVQQDNKGREILKPAKKAEPGQKIEYQLVYANSSKSAMRAGAITGPIPAETHYIANSSNTRIQSKLLVSIDAGKSFEQEPVTRQKKMPNGKMKTVVIPAEKYTHVRWKPVKGLGAGEQQRYHFRVQVNL